MEDHFVKTNIVEELIDMASTFHPEIEKSDRDRLIEAAGTIIGLQASLDQARTDLAVLARFIEEGHLWKDYRSKER